MNARIENDVLILDNLLQHVEIPVSAIVKIESNIPVGRFTRHCFFIQTDHGTWYDLAIIPQGVSLSTAELLRKLVELNPNISISSDIRKYIETGNYFDLKSTRYFYFYAALIILFALVLFFLFKA